MATFDAGVRHDPVFEAALPWWASGRERAAHSAVSADGAVVIVAGEAERGSGQRGVLVVAFAAQDGSELWNFSHHSSEGYHYDNSEDVLPHAACGLVYVLATVLTEDSGGGESDILLLALETTTGTLVWSDRIAGRNDSRETGTSLVLSTDQETLYVGGTAWVDRNRQYLLASYDACSGGRNWVSTVGTPSNEEMFDLGVSADGTRLFAAGSLGDGAGVMAVDTSNGTPLWSYIEGVGTWFTTQWRVAVDPDGHWVATGGRLEDKPRLLWLDQATGELIQAVDRDEDLGFRRLALSSDGSILYASTRTATTAFRTSDASALWTTEGPGGLALSKDEELLYVVTNVQSPLTEQDCRLRAIATSDGGILWEATFRGQGMGVRGLPLGVPGKDACVDPVADPWARHVYVAGNTWTPEGSEDLLLVAFRADGPAPEHLMGQVAPRLSDHASARGAES